MDLWCTRRGPVLDFPSVPHRIATSGHRADIRAHARGVADSVVHSVLHEEFAYQQLDLPWSSRRHFMYLPWTFDILRTPG